MTLLYWLLLLLLAGLCIWGGRRYRTQARRLQRLKSSLEQANQRLQESTGEHRSASTRWEEEQSRLRSYLQQLDTLINTISNPIYFKDEQGVFQGCNLVFSEQILGLPQDRINGKRAQDLPDQIPADLAALYQREESKVVEKEGPHTFEAQVQRADGQRREFLFSVAPLTDARGNFGGSVAVLSDLTDKNRAARDRLQKEKLEGVLETAGAVCHEMNQPLQAISGYTELMAAQVKDQTAMAFIEKLTAQIQRMRDITDKLQGITRVEVADYAGDTKIIDIHKSSQDA